MGSKEYKFEIWMRWGFALALVVVLGFWFFESPYYRLTPALFGAKQDPSAARCQLRISRDFEHSASLDLSGMEALVRRATDIRSGFSVALEACRRDPTLKAVFLRQSCDRFGGQLSRTVFCQ